MTGELTASADVQVRTALPNSLAFGGHCVSQILRPATTARRRGTGWRARPGPPTGRTCWLSRLSRRPQYREVHDDDPGNRPCRVLRRRPSEISRHPLRRLRFPHRRAWQAPGAGPAGQRSLLLRQGQIRLLLTTAGSADHPAADYVRQHGDGVAVIAFRTDDVRRTFAETVAAGAAPLASPAFATAGQSTVGTAVVSGFGDVQHKLIERTGADSEFAPGTIEMTRPGDHIPGACPGRPDDAAELLVALDHIAVCLPADELDDTVRFYRDVFGLAQIFDERIEVGTQAMLSKVVQDESASGDLHADRAGPQPRARPDRRVPEGTWRRRSSAPGVQDLRHRSTRSGRYPAAAWSS